MRRGVLRQGFTFNTVIGIRVTLPKGIPIVRTRNFIYFITEDSSKNQPIRAFKTEHGYFVDLYGNLYRLQQFSPRVPFPLSWL